MHCSMAMHEPHQLQHGLFCFPTHTYAHTVKLVFYV